MSDDYGTRSADGGSLRITSQHSDGQVKLDSNVVERRFTPSTEKEKNRQNPGQRSKKSRGLLQTPVQQDKGHCDEMGLESLVLSADEQYKQNDYARSIKLYNRALKIQPSSPVADSEADTTASTIQLSFSSIDENDAPDETNGIYCEIEMTSIANSILSTTKLLLKKGNACYKSTNYDDAIETFTTALETLKSFTARESESWHRHEKGTDRAPEPHSLAALDDAHQVSERASNSVRLELNVHLSRIWNNLGNAYLKKAAYSWALSAYEESFELKTKLLRSLKKGCPSSTDVENTPENENLVASDPDRFGFQQYSPEVEVGRTLHNIGLVYSLIGRKKLPIESFKESLVWKRKLAPSNRNHKVLDVAIANTLFCLAGVIVSSQSDHMHMAAAGKKSPVEKLHSINEDADEEGPEKQKFVSEDDELKEQNMNKAMQMYLQALSLRKECLGCQHPDVATTLYNIAILEYKLQNFGQCAKIAKEALAIQKRRLSDDNAALVGSTLHVFGVALLKLEQYDNALTTLRRALKMKLITCQEDNHLSLMTVRFDIGMVHYKRNSLGDAMSLFHQVWKVRRSKLGPDHDAVATSLFAISQVLSHVNKCDSAIEGYREVLRVRERCLGRNHLGVAEVFDALGVTHIKKGSYRKAEKMFKKALQVYGANSNADTFIARTLRQMADLKLDQGEDAQALGLYQQILETRKSPKSLNMGGIYYTVGNIQFQMGDYVSSKVSYAEALKIMRPLLERDHEDILSTVTKLGHSLYKVGQLEDALEAYEESLSLKQDVICPGEQDFSSFLDAVGNREIDRTADKWHGISVSLGEVASTLTNMGIVHQKLGKSGEALKVYKLALKVRKLLPEMENRDAIAVTSEKVGLIEFNLGQYDAALSSFAEALKIKKRHHGSKSVEVAHTLNSIANVQYSYGKFDKCMEMYQEALKIKRVKLGECHIDTSNTLNNIANVYHVKGNYDEAVRSYTEALSIKRKLLGNNHLDVAATLSNLGDVQCKWKQFDEALSMYEEALRIRRAEACPNYLEIAILMSNLGTINHMQGKYKRALKVLSEEVNIRKSKLIEDSRALAVALTNLGRTYHQLRQFDDALKTYKESLHVQEGHVKDFDAKSPSSESRTGTEPKDGQHHEVKGTESGFLGDFASTLRNIGLVYQDKGRIEKALNAFKAALKYKQMQLGADNLDAAFICESIGLCYFNLKDYSASLASFSEALRVKKLNLSEESVDVATTLNNVANVHYTLGQLPQAMEAYAKAFLIKKALLGEDHIDIAIMLNNIAGIYAEEGDIDESIATYSEALRVRRQHLGDDDRTVGTTLYNLGEMYAKKGDFVQASSRYMDALRIRTTNFGKNHVDVIAVVDNIANLYANHGNHGRAVKFYVDSLQAKEETLGKDHLEYARTLEKMAISLIDLGQYSEALKSLRKALPIKKTKLGENHKEFLATLSRIGVIHNLSASHAER